MILDGLLLINGVDVWQEYGVFLSEDKAGDYTNYTALLKPAAMKPHVAVAFREENGERLPDNLLMRSEARDVTLYFAIMAADAATFITNYAAFVQFLKGGWLEIEVPETGRTFRMYCAACSDYSQLTPLDGDAVGARFKVKFREPEPGF
jgi:hypothetical protein